MLNLTSWLFLRTAFHSQHEVVSVFLFLASYDSSYSDGGHSSLRLAPLIRLPMALLTGRLVPDVGSTLSLESALMPIAPDTSSTSLDVTGYEIAPEDY